jgi:hypothetical protein
MSNENNEETHAIDVNLNNTNNTNMDNLINKITMDCLISKNQKQKMIHYSSNKQYDKKDKKFYRRRIINLTREMLLNNYSDDILHDVKEAFDIYVKTCIGFFKVKDEVDIIQSDMCFLEEVTNDVDKLDLDDIVTPEEANKLMMRTIKINKLPLDNFVTIKTMKIANDPIMPKQKEINLKDPQLKNKGINRKKNIPNKYIDNEKEIKNEK